MPHFTDVLAAIDLGPGSEAVLGFAARLAVAEARSLTVLHVISPKEEADRAEMPGDSHFADVMMTEVESELEQLVERIEPHLADVRCVARLGDPVAEITGEAAQTDSLLVIGLRHRSRVGKFLLGSNLQDILLTTRRPVVAVPIDGSIDTGAASREAE